MRYVFKFFSGESEAGVFKLCYLDYVVHVREQAIHSHFQQHHQGPAHVLPYLWLFVTSQGEEILLQKKYIAL